MKAIDDIEVLRRDYTVPGAEWRAEMTGGFLLMPTEDQWDNGPRWCIAINPSGHIGISGHAPPGALVAAGCAASGQKTPAMMEEYIAEIEDRAEMAENDLQRRRRVFVLEDLLADADAQYRAEMEREP